MDSETKEDDVTERILTAFAPYALPSQDIISVRHSIAQYIGRLAQNLEQKSSYDLANIPTDVTGSRRKYLESLRANRIARLEYESSVKQAKEQSPAIANGNINLESDGSLIGGHLEILRQRKYNIKLGILQHYADELETMATEQKLFSTLGRGDILDSEPQTEDSNLSQAVQYVQEDIKKLEFAVINAKQQLAREQLLTREVKLRIDELQTTSSATRLHALSATRRELTNWLEDSLSNCNIQDSTAIQGEETNSEELDLREHLKQSYESYVAERRRLLESIVTLSDSEKDENVKSIKDLPKPDTLSLTESPSTLELQNRLLSMLQQQKLISLHQSFLSSQLEKDKEFTLETLGRLSDESQLLPAYPILASSGKFQNALSTFGQKSGNLATDDATIERVKGWSFATTTAREASADIVEKNISQGQKAMEEVEGNIKDIQFFRKVIQQEKE